MGIEDILVRVLNRRSAKPVRSTHGLLVGQAENLIGTSAHPFSLAAKPAQHTFICGRTGSGKTTLVLRLMAEHMRLGLPFAFTDFHGPATDEVLKMLAGQPSNRQALLLEPWSDVVLGWNPLDTNGELPYGVVQELIGIFHRRLWPDAWGPRLEELLRMTFLALAEARLTLLEATAFLSHPEFRRAVLRHCTISEVREFWTVRFERLSPSQRSVVTETVLNKLSVFHDPSLKYVVGQASNTLNFDQALAEGQTILANLSTGNLRGGDFLLSALLVATLKSAIYRRPQGAPPYTIFLDEFQEMVALDALDDYLRSFRKFGCSVYLATQHLELPKELKAAIFGNCSRFFCFATSAADAAFLGREFGGPEGALITEILPDLPTGHAVVKVRGEKAGLLRVASPPQGGRPKADDIAAGRARCLTMGLSRKELEKEIEDRRLRFLGPDVKREKQAEVAKAAFDRAAGNLPEGYESP